MSNPLLKAFIRTRFLFTSQKAASAQIEKVREQYERIASKISDKTGTIPILIPKMIGIDEDMRSWSFFIILEHNAIVNHAITRTMQKLALGEAPTAERHFDPKKDVMPSSNPGMEQIKSFMDSIENHLQILSTLPKLRGTETKPHPLFGPFDAHQWHCMFPVHLQLHLRQAEYVLRHAMEESQP